MKRLITLFIATVVFLKATAGVVMADTPVVSSSAKPFTRRAKTKVDFRTIKLKRYLEKHSSPLAEHSDDFIYYADKYNLDWRMVPAIAGVESTFGKRIPYNSYNAYGWANGRYCFDSWESSINIVSKTLREKYYDRGADSIDEISRIYAPPSNSWGWKVKFFMNKIERYPLEFTL